MQRLADDMKVLFGLMLAVASSALSVAARADSGSVTSSASQSGFIAEFDNTLAPLQYVKFCMNYRGECEASESQQELPPPDRARKLLQDVNVSVNAAISPTRKSTDPMTAHWTLSPSAGDCNDYAVTKRHKLVALGWPQSALRLAVVLTEGGQGHLVLVVRLNDGDVVLDNLSSTVRPWKSLDYVWISMQSGSNPRFWVAIGDRGQRLQTARLASTKSAL